MTKDSTDPHPSSPDEIAAARRGGVPGDRWKEGLLFEGKGMTPGIKGAANWLPQTESLGLDEMQIIFMGSTPVIRPGQMNTSIFVRLGNGDSFIFDLGEGAIANYVAGGFALNELNDVFITHLHVDHFGSLPYLYMFGGHWGRWHEPLRIFGPSGRTEKDGVAYMVDGMQRMLHWHRDAFDIFPVKEAWDVEVHEFDFRDNGGVIYDQNGVKVIHWQRSHVKDGASAYRLDWNGLSVAWTGDGRPTALDVDYAEGVDVFITELQAELVGITSEVEAMPLFMLRYTLDTHHTPGYAAGYLATQVNPRLLMATHMPVDAYLIEETVAEVRHHWKGPFSFGAPDGIVVNVTAEDIWVRQGVLPPYPDMRAPQHDFSNGALVIPRPNQRREDMQEPFVREQEIPPADYYPEGYHPELMTDWPIDSDLVIPLDEMPAEAVASMGENWRQREAYKKHISELEADEQ